MKQRKKNYRAPLTSKVYHESKKEKTYTLNNKKTAFLKLCTKFSNPGFKHQFLSNYPNIMKGKNFKSLELGGNESKKSREISGKNPIIIKRFLTQQPSDCWHSLLVSHKKQPEKEKKKNKCWREHLRTCGGQLGSCAARQAREEALGEPGSLQPVPTHRAPRLQAGRRVHLPEN